LEKGSLSSSRLITLDKANPDFSKYIWGTFSGEERALPLQSLNVNSATEQVTFEIVGKTEPIFSELVIQTLKIRNLYLGLAPLFFVLVKNALDETLGDELLAVLSAVAVMCLQMGIELANDVQDHVRGLDRVHPRSGNPALKKGWLSARQLKNISWILIATGGFFGLPSLVIFPEIFMVLLPLFALGFWGALSDRMGFKYRSWSEWVVFMMFGPLLTTGYQISIGGGVDIEVVALGCLTGWLTVLQVHLKNFDQLMVNAQAGFNNTMVRLGFERAKTLILVWWTLFVAALVIYQSIYSQTVWKWIFAVALVAVSLPFIFVISKLQVSVGSRIHRAVLVATRVSQFALSLWLFQNIWFLLVIEGVL
jgi:1,4-dihydroxy-2-naphthoate octaprenyltransferase